MDKLDKLVDCSTNFLTEIQSYVDLIQESFGDKSIKNSFFKDDNWIFIDNVFKSNSTDKLKNMYGIYIIVAENNNYILPIYIGKACHNSVDIYNRVITWERMQYNRTEEDFKSLKEIHLWDKFWYYLKIFYTNTNISFQINLYCKQIPYKGSKLISIRASNRLIGEIEYSLEFPHSENIIRPLYRQKGIKSKSFDQSKFDKIANYFLKDLKKDKNQACEK